MEQNIVDIPLHEIKPDPTQPRKQYDESALQELSVSIASSGVRQPILVRPKGKSYVIVFGERRYRASKLAGKETIPAMVRAMSEAEVLEAQLEENLHRQDPHPLDEAVAFKRFVDLKKLSVEEVAAKMGKPMFYIRQRLKLLSLISSWQIVFFRNIIKITEALQMAQLPESTQEMLYDTLADESQFAKPGYKITIDKSQFERYRGNLSAATFDTLDANLHSNGACTGCQYNTSFATLFPDDAAVPRCTNITCYNAKTANAFKLNLEQAKKDPGVVLIKDYGTNNKKLVDSLKKEGLPVLETSEYSEVDIPEKPDWETFKEEHPELDEADLREDFQIEMNAYDEEFVMFQKRVDSGKYLKAFVVDGADAGQVMYITLAKKKQGETPVVTGKPVDAEAAQAAEIRAEIERLKEREQRNEELDRIKVHNQVKAALKANKDFTDCKAGINKQEGIALAVIAYTESYLAKDFLRKVLKIKDEWITEPVDLYIKLSEMKDADAVVIICKAVRLMFLSKLITSESVEQDPLQHAKAAAIRAIAVKYLPDEVNQFDADQAAKAADRKERLQKRLTGMEQQLARLESCELPASKQEKIKKTGINALTEGSHTLNN